MPFLVQLTPEIVKRMYINFGVQLLERIASKRMDDILSRAVRRLVGEAYANPGPIIAPSAEPASGPAYPKSKPLFVKGRLLIL